MKRYLLMIRHADSEMMAYDGSDFNRNLTSEGIENAISLGEELLNKAFQADLIVSSAALRTSLTSQKIAEKINFPKEKIQYENTLYSPSADFLFRFLSQVSAAHQQVIIVNHNPAISRVASYLTGQSINMSTANAICLCFELDNWAELTADIAKIVWTKEF